MARILYGIAGEGMGHAIRSKPVIEHLSKKHQIIIVSSNRPYDFLKKHFKNVYNIHGLHISYNRNKVHRLKTILENSIQLPKGTYNSLKKLNEILKNFKPDIAISDFEPFTCYISNLFKIPLISIDNMHVMMKCDLDVPKKYYKNCIAAKMIIKSFIIKADYYLINSFFFPRRKTKNAFLFYPVLRKDILKAKIQNKGYILVYQTSRSNNKLKQLLKKIDKKFIVYGFNDSKKDKNLVFKKFNEKQFIQDLASCEALITNGGFTTIAEALYLKKPILSEPVKKHFEQILSALYLERLGYGEFHDEINVETVKNFVSRIPKYKSNLKKYKRQDNSKFFNKLDKLIKSLS